MQDNQMAGAESAGANEGRYANLADVGTEEVTEKPVEEPAQTEEKAEEPVEDAEEKKRKSGFKRKYERKEAEIAELRAELEKVRAQAPQPKTEAEGKPKLEDFKDKTYEEYYEAVADWKVEQKLKEKDSKAHEQELRKEMDTKTKAYRAQVEEFKKTVKDFDEVVESYDGPLTLPMQQALLDSDMGPELTYYLAQNPEEAEKLADLGPLQLNKAIGRIEARIEAKKSEKPEVKASKAPPPITPVGKSSNSTVDPYRGEMSYEDYRAWRAKQKR